MTILLLQLDGALPNLALMRIVAHHHARGDNVRFQRATGPLSVERGLFDELYDRVYASLIFERSRPVAERLLGVWPRAIVGGTGWDATTTLSDIGAVEDCRPDYSIYPDYPHSIGFTQRGCRLRCSFCVVPRKEGAVSGGTSVYDIWRGEPHPKNLVLLDNDFFGHPAWPERVREIREGQFRVCFCQGINARFLTPETAEAVASVDYFDSDFRKRRLYTAWDNRRDEARLFRGLECLKAAGVPPGRVMVYVLVGYDHEARAARPHITDDDVYRVERLRDWGADPYPMPFVRTRETIGFQRWVLRYAHKSVGWSEFKAGGFNTRNSVESTPTLFVCGDDV